MVLVLGASHRIPMDPSTRRSRLRGSQTAHDPALGCPLATHTDLSRRKCPLKLVLLRCLLVTFQIPSSLAVPRAQPRQIPSFFEKLVSFHLRRRRHHLARVGFRHQWLASMAMDCNGPRHLHLTTHKALLGHSPSHPFHTGSVTCEKSKMAVLLGAHG